MRISSASSELSDLANAEEIKLAHLKNENGLYAIRKRYGRYERISLKSQMHNQVKNMNNVSQAGNALDQMFRRLSHF